MSLSQIANLENGLSVRTKLNSLIDLYNTVETYNVKLYGLAGDGVTDDRAALNTLLNTTAASGSTIYFPPGTYNISSVITMSNKYFHFVGNGSTIAMTGNSQILDMASTVALTGSGSRWTFRGLTFNGTGVGGSQSGLYFRSFSGLFNVSDCLFTNFANAGIAVGNTQNASTTQAGSFGGLITSCRFYNNGIGVTMLDRGEYVHVTGCQFVANTTGIKTIGGNSVIDGNTISYNDTGIEIASGTNAGKDIISNNHICHNATYSLNIHDVPANNGLNITDNHLIFGTLRIKDNLVGIVITGGQINAAAYTFDTNVSLTFKGVLFTNSLANTITLTGTAPIYENCVNTNGTYAYDADTFGSTPEARVSTTDATVTTIQTIPCASSTTTATVGYVVARRTGGSAGTAEDGAMYRVEFAANNIGGTATLIGTAVVTVIGENQAGWDVTVVGSGANMLIKVTGAINNNINWKWVATNQIIR